MSATTTSAPSVDASLNPTGSHGDAVGEIVDFSCYLQIGKHGDKHRACAQKCFNNGQPRLLTKEGALYMPGAGRARSPARMAVCTSVREAAIDHMPATSWKSPAPRPSSASTLSTFTVFLQEVVS